MSGTKNGGKSAAMTNRRKYGDDFYARIGAIGGKNGHTGGFYANRELAREAGRKGGLISRKRKVVKQIPVQDMNDSQPKSNNFITKLFKKETING